MGPFSGRLLSVSIAMLPGSRTSQQRQVNLDSRFMSQWMKAAKSSRAAITEISTGGFSPTRINKGRTECSQDESETLIEKMSAQFPSLTKKAEPNKVGKSGDSKPKANRRRGRRKST